MRWTKRNLFWARVESSLFWEQVHNCIDFAFASYENRVFPLYLRRKEQFLFVKLAYQLARKTEFGWLAKEKLSDQTEKEVSDYT